MTLRWVVVGAGVCAAGSASGAPRTDTVALSGQPAPGVVNGSFARFELKPGISANGGVVFIASLRDDFSASVGKAIFAGQPGGLAMAARTNASPTDAFTDLVYTPVLDATGRVGFAAVTAGGTGVFSGYPGNVQTVAKTGQATPGDAFTTFDVFPGALAMNSSGRVAFPAQTLFFGVLQGMGVYAGQPGALQTVATNGEPLPGTSMTPLGYFAPGINASGQVAFSGLLSSNLESQDGDAIWMGLPGALSAVAVEGQPAPGAGPGVLYGGGRLNLQTGALDSVGFLGGSLNSGGELAFVGRLKGAGVTPANDRALWVKRAAGVQMLARTGSPAPGAGAGAVFADFTELSPQPVTPHDPTLSDSGRVAFFATLAGPGVTASDNEGLWVGDETKLELVARTGRRAPGAGTGVTFKHLQYPSLNALGEMAFVADLAGAGVPAGGAKGIWARDLAGHVVMLAREGGTLAVRPGDVRPIQTLTVNLGNNNVDGVPDGLNGEGKVAYSATFADGSSGVFVTQIPYPCDANGDDAVTRADFLVLRQNMGLTGPAVPGDFDYDGRVGFADLQLLELYFGKSRPASGAVAGAADSLSAADLASVPEPGAGALGVIAAAWVGRRRRRA